MGRGEPALFEVTHRIRNVFHRLLRHVVDNFLAGDLNIKLLQYVFACSYVRLPDLQ